MTIKQLRMEAIRQKNRTMKFKYSTKRDASGLEPREGHFEDCYTGQFRLSEDERMFKGKSFQLVESFHERFGNIFDFTLIID